jgi:hypothetical protein
MGEPMKVTLTQPGLEGDYIVEERHEDGRLLLAPDAEDLHHATRAGREVDERERARLEREGIPTDELQPCAPVGPEGPDSQAA